MPFPETVKRSVIDRMHPEVSEWRDAWERYRLLVAGGDEIKRRAADFLPSRPKEHDDVYAFRCKRFTYENHLGSAVSWYRSRLFGSTPAAATKKEKGPEAGLLGRLMEGCDLQREKPFWEAWGDLFRDMVTYGRAVYVVDRPATSPQSRAEETSGKADPYMAVWSPQALLNYSRLEDGRLGTAVLRDHRYEPAILEEKPRKWDRWVVYDRESYAIYEAEESKQDAVMVKEGTHALYGTRYRENPVRLISLSPEYWLANRAVLPVEEHIALDNGASHLMYTSNLALMVIKSDSDFNQTVAQTSYIKLGIQDELEYAEPEGRSLEAALKSRAEKREEIYRSCHLMAQGRSSDATDAAASGLSKQLDMAPAQDVLDAYGERIRREAATSLYLMLAVGGYEPEIEVTGFSFGTEDPTELIDMATRLRGLNVQSPTLYREVDKRLTRACLENQSEVTIQKAVAEVDSGPDFLALQEQQKKEEMAARNAAFAGA